MHDKTTKKLLYQTEFYYVEIDPLLPCFQSLFVSEQIYRRCPADFSLDVGGAKGKKLPLIKKVM